MGEAGLPLEGSWPHDWHGSLGSLTHVITNDSALLVCHCCGEMHEDLSKHVRAHGLTADAYRTMWGLNSTHALVNDRLKAIKSELGKEHGHRLTQDEAHKPTPEQRSRWSRAREARAETKLRRGEQPRASTGVWVPRKERPIMARLARKGGRT